MNTLPVVSLTASSSFKFFHFPSLHRSLSHSPNFSFTKSLILNPNHLSFKSTLNSLSPSQSQLYEEEDDEEEEEEDEDDDDEAADEYDNISDEIRNSDDDDDDEETEFSVDLPTESARERVEFRWQRVEKLRSLVRDFGVEMIDIDELISIYDFRIDKFQRLAIEAFLRGSSVVVSAPTSSGKTLIAEAAAVSTVAKGRRLFYTTPLKALSNQKFREFRETFGDDNVGLLTGDSAINKDAQIVIMTTEILRNMLYQSVGMASSGTGLFHVDAIVLDEVHYLSDISRGTVWEEIVSFFSHCFSSFLQRLYLLSVSKLVSVFQIRSGHLLSKGGSTYMPISYSCKSG
jgi:superfamily II RNA helicase